MNLCQTLWASYNALKQAHSDAEMFLEEGKNLSLVDYKNALEKLSKAKEDYNKSFYTTLPDGREIYTLDYLSIIRLCDVNEVDLNEILAEQKDDFLVDRRVNSINLYGTKVSDLTPVAGLTNLIELWCYNTKVSDLTPLARLTNLNELWCYETQVSDLTPLAGLTKLQWLNCTNTQVSDLTPLANLTNLIYVNAENNKLDANSIILAQQKRWKI